MTPPWLRLLDPSYRLTLALNDSVINDAQMGAQTRRRRRLGDPAPTVAPAVTTPPVPEQHPQADNQTATPRTVAGNIINYDSNDHPNLPAVDTCNFTRTVRTIRYTNPVGGHDEFTQVTDARPRPGFRVCSTGIGFNFGDHGVSTLFRNLGFGILVGPERSSSGYAQIEAHLGEGIVGYLRLSGGNLATDGASSLNGAPMSAGTTPSVSGWWGAINAGLSHRDSHVGSWTEFTAGNTSRVGIQLGFTTLSVDHPATGTSGDPHPNFRFSITRESDLFGINFPHARLAFELFPGVANFAFDDGAVSGCHGAFCSWSDLLHRSPFIPLSVRLDFYPSNDSVPSTASDAWVAPGQTRHISTEEFVFNLANRAAGEMVNLWGRGASTHQFIGVQAGLGTGGAGLSTSSSQYTTAGLAQFALSSMRGMSRGSDVIAEGDILRNSTERRLGIFLTEGGILAINMALYLGLRNRDGTTWSASDFWTCAGSTPASGEACSRNPYADSNGGSARMNFFEDLGYGGLLALDATGAMGDPRRGDGHFWAANLSAAALGLVGIFSATKLADLGGSNVGGNGFFGWSLLGDTSPFFNGSHGTYDPITDNFLRHRQDANIITSTSAMLLSYSIGRFLRYSSYQSAARDAILNPPPNNTPGHTSGYHPGLRSARLDVLPGGATLSLSGEF